MIACSPLSSSAGSPVYDTGEVNETGCVNQFSLTGYVAKILPVKVFRAAAWTGTAGVYVLCDQIEAGAAASCFKKWLLS